MPMEGIIPINDEREHLSKKRTPKPNHRTLPLHHVGFIHCSNLILGRQNGASLWWQAKLNNYPRKCFKCSSMPTKQHTHVRTHTQTMQEPPAVCTEIANFLANSSERMGALNYLPSRTQTLSDIFCSHSNPGLSRADNQTCKTSAMYEFCKSITLGKQKPKQIEKSYK